MATFRERCGKDGYAALIAYEMYLPSEAREFVNHLAREPDRAMTAKQDDWAGEIITRSILHNRIRRGMPALPPSLDYSDPDDDDDGPDDDGGAPARDFWAA